MAHQQVTVSFSITVQGAPLIPIIPSPVPEATVNQPYALTLGALGGTPPYVWTAVSVPPGMTITPAGVISWTPTSPGTFSVQLNLDDSGV